MFALNFLRGKYDTFILITVVKPMVFDNTFTLAPKYSMSIILSVIILICIMYETFTHILFFALSRDDKTGVLRHSMTR